MDTSKTTTTRLGNFPISFFAMVMGLSGLTIAIEKALSLSSADVPYLVNGLLFLTAGVFTLLLVTYLAKLIRHTDVVLEEFRHPVKLNFFPAVSISLLLLSVAFLDIDKGISEPLWLMGVTWHLVLTLYVVNAWMHHEHFKVQHINPAWFIPAVGNVIVPVAGVPLGYLELSWFFFSVGMLFWGILLIIIFYRLMFHAPMDEKLLPTLFILIAPPAVGFIAYRGLVGEIDTFARVLYDAGLFMTLLLFTQLPRFLKLRFFLSWWAYSFPLAAISIASMLMFEHTGEVFYGWLSATLVSSLILLIGLLLARTLKAVLSHRICIPEH